MFFWHFFFVIIRSYFLWRFLMFLVYQLFIPSYFLKPISYLIQIRYWNILKITYCYLMDALWHLKNSAKSCFTIIYHPLVVDVEFVQNLKRFLEFFLQSGDKIVWKWYLHFSNSLCLCDQLNDKFLCLLICPVVYSF